MNKDPIPFLDLVSLHKPLEEELIAVCRRAIKSARFIGGLEVEGFEQEFAAYCGVPFCAGVGNGTDAVRFALMACGVGKGDAVVTVSHTFIATIEAISQTGAAVEFVDIDERTYNMSPSCLRDYLGSCEIDGATGRPRGKRSGLPIKAVVPVHLYGQCSNMDPILDLAAKYGLVVIEDAAQAQGAEYLTRCGHPASGVRNSEPETVGFEPRWQRAGSFGKAAAFSFYPGKNLGACGEAGAVVSSDEEVIKKVKMIRDHGQAQKYYHHLEGYNGRLDAIQAGMLRIKLRHLDEWNSKRRAAAKLYGQLLAKQSNADLVTIPYEPENTRSIYHLYVIRHPNRDGLMAYLENYQIYTALHYPVPVHLQHCYRDWNYRPGDLPVTERVTSEILSLPMFPDLTPEQVDRASKRIGSFSGSAEPVIHTGLLDS
ncbi:MAG: DegT/DnrJ/EryC1/StrS family aminotransferase [Acidobacteriota bacterium]